MNDKISVLKQKLKKIATNDYDEKNYDSLSDINQIEQIIRKIEGDNLKNLLKKCYPGHEKWRLFQDFCFELVKITLEKSEFTECKTRSELQTSYAPLDSKASRKDIIIPLTPKQFTNKDDIKNIWDEFRYDPWNCKYLVFDAKNYKSSITHNQIYQMFHYLNKRNGKIGIIFSRKHTVDKSGQAALRRIREEDYIIFVLSDKTVGKWIDAYIEEGHVRTFFRDLKTKFDHSFLV